MADRLVSELTENTTLDATDELYLEAGLNGRKMSVANFGLTLPVTPTGATTARTLADWLGDAENLIAHGGNGDGSANNTTAIIDWLNAAMTNGKPAFAPAGTYLMDAWGITILTGALSVICAPDAIFKYRTAESVPLFSFKHDTRDIHEMSWVGGQIDNTGGTSASAAQSNTCIELVRLRRFAIKGVRFVGEATYGAANTVPTGTDSGVTTVDCKKGIISECDFRGQGDAGIYISGGATDSDDQTDDGGEIKIIGNDFTQCDQMITIKRGAARNVVMGNTGRDNRVGVALIGTDVGSVYRAGQSTIIALNTFKKTETRAIELKERGNCIVVGNIIEDFGYEPDGSTLSSIPHAIRVFGSSSNIIRGNTIRNVEWAKDAGHIGIRLNRLTQDAVNYDPADNQVDGNSFEGVTVGISEEANAGINYYGPNVYASDVDTPISLTNGGSVQKWANSGKTWEQYNNVGNVGAGEDDLHSISLPASTLNADGRTLRITMYGSTSGSADSKTLKIYFGATIILTASLTTSQISRWRFEGMVIRNSSGSQKVSGTLWQTDNSGGGTVITEVENATLSETDTSAITVKATGEATSNNDILQAVTVLKLEN